LEGQEEGLGGDAADAPVRGPFDRFVGVVFGVAMQVLRHAAIDHPHRWLMSHSCIGLVHHRKKAALGATALHRIHAEPALARRQVEGLLAEVGAPESEVASTAVSYAARPSVSAGHGACRRSAAGSVPALPLKAAHPTHYTQRYVSRHPQLAVHPHPVGVLTVVSAVAGTRSSVHRSPLDDEDFSHARNLAPHFRVRSRRL
jgi:hypothetical protein